MPWTILSTENMVISKTLLYKMIVFKFKNFQYSIQNFIIYINDLKFLFLPYNRGKSRFYVLIVYTIAIFAYSCLITHFVKNIRTESGI